MLLLAGVDEYSFANGEGPKQNLKGPSIEIHYQFSNFGRSIEPSIKFHKGQFGFSGARGSYLQESPGNHMLT